MGKRDYNFLNFPMKTTETEISGRLRFFLLNVKILGVCEFFSNYRMGWDQIISGLTYSFNKLRTIHSPIRPVYTI